MIRNGWYRCPICKRNIQKVTPASIVYETPIYCRSCKLEFYPRIYRGRELHEAEPFPGLHRV